MGLKTVIYLRNGLCREHRVVGGAWCTVVAQLINHFSKSHRADGTWHWLQHKLFAHQPYYCIIISFRMKAITSAPNLHDVIQANDGCR